MPPEIQKMTVKSTTRPVSEASATPETKLEAEAKPPTKAEAAAAASAAAASADGSEDSDAGGAGGVGSFDGSQLLLGLMSDPDVQAILRAKQAGQQIRVVTDTRLSQAKASAKETEEVDDTDELSELDDDMKRIVKILNRSVSSQLGPLTDKLNALEGIANTFQKQAVNGQIKTAATKHADFNRYRKPMAELARSTGAGLSVEELYLIAKSRSGNLRLTEPSTHSERPTPTPRRRDIGEKKVGAGVSEADATARLRRGRKGFQTVLADALDNLEFSPGD